MFFYSFFNLFLKALYLQGIQSENNFCKEQIFEGLVGVKVGVGGVMDKKRTKDWQYSVGKIGAILQLLCTLVCVQWSFLGRGIYSNNINAMNKRQTICL